MKNNNKLSDKSILYIVHKYNSFQKDPIEEAAKYFKKVYVLVRYKPISSIAKWLPFKWVKSHDDSIVLDLKNIPDNVFVIKTPIWYLPFGVFYKILGSLHYKAVKKVIKTNNIKFDLIHCHFLWSAGYVGMKLKSEYNVPFIVTGQGFDVYDLPFQDKFWNKITKEILKSADKILTVSNFNKGYLLNLGTNIDKIKVIDNGFSDKMFFPQKKVDVRKMLGLSQEKKIFVSVGNLEKVKGFDILIKSMEYVIKSKKNIECYIIGMGSQYPQLLNLIKNLKLEKRVFLMGFQKHDQIGTWICASDLFIIPSRRESASVVLLEALACGRPIVATKVGIVPDVITSSKWGYISETENPKALSIQMKKALKNKWDLVGISKYSKKFTWENSVKRIIETYKEIL